MSSPGHRLDSIDALRAIAMLAVIAQHCGLLPLGWMGVWLFYVISGYVITAGIESRHDSAAPLGQRYGHFMFLRAARIIPALLFYVLLCGIYAASTGALSAWSTQGLSVLAFVHNWWMIDAIQAQETLWPPFSHLWTISVEQQFYLAFPLLAMVMPRAWRVPACMALILAAPLVRAMTSLLLPEAASPGQRAFAIYAASHTQIDSFLMGALIAYGQREVMARSGWWRWLLPASLLVASVYALGHVVTNALAGARGTDLLRNIFSGILYGQGREVWVYSVAMLLSGAAVAGAVRAAPQTGPMKSVLAWVGRRSYSGYLVHLLVIVVLLKISGGALVKQLGPAERLMLFLASAGLTFAAMHLMYRWVETPAQRWAKTWLSARHGSQRAARRAS